MERDEVRCRKTSLSASPRHPRQSPNSPDPRWSSSPRAAPPRIHIDPPYSPGACIAANVSDPQFNFCISLTFLPSAVHSTKPCSPSAAPCPPPRSAAMSAATGGATRVSVSCERSQHQRVRRRVRRVRVLSPLHVALCSGKFTTPPSAQNATTGCGAYRGEMAVWRTWGRVGAPRPRSAAASSACRRRRSRTRSSRRAGASSRRASTASSASASRCRSARRIDAVLAEVRQLNDIKGMLDPSRVVIAYEPVWAIGTGVTAPRAGAGDARRHPQVDRQGVRPGHRRRHPQYGGSANARTRPTSRRSRHRRLLVGGASLKPEFADIVKAISAA